MAEREKNMSAGCTLILLSMGIGKYVKLWNWKSVNINKSVECTGRCAICWRMQYSRKWKSVYVCKTWQEQITDTFHTLAQIHISSALFLFSMSGKKLFAQTKSVFTLIFAAHLFDPFISLFLSVSQATGDLIKQNDNV